MKEAVIYVNDVITSNAYSYGSYYSYGVSAKTLQKQLDAWVYQNGAYDSVKVLIHSPGGDPLEGEAIHGFLRSLGVPIETLVFGMAASATTLVSLAGDKGKRKMARLSSYMIHRPSASNFGTEEVMQGTADWLKKYGKKYADFYAEETGLDPKKVYEMMKAETWFTAIEAKEMGFVDQILSSSELSEATSDMAKYQVENFSAAMRFGVITPGVGAGKPSMKSNFQPKNPKAGMSTKTKQTQAAKGKGKGAEPKGFSSFLKSIREFLASHEEAKDDDEPKMLILSTTDGQELTVETEDENPAPGDAVMIDGDAAEDGEYELSSGGTVVVSGGEVEEYIEAEAPTMKKKKGAQAKSQANADSQMAAQLKATSTKLARMQKDYADMKAKFEAEIESNAEFKISIMKLLKGLTSMSAPVDVDDSEDGKKSKKNSMKNEAEKALASFKSRGMKAGLDDEEEDEDDE